MGVCFNSNDERKRKEIEKEIGEEPFENQDLKKSPKDSKDIKPVIEIKKNQIDSKDIIPKNEYKKNNISPKKNNNNRYNNKKSINSFGGYQDKIVCIIELHSKSIAIGSYDKTIKIWNINSNILENTINGEGKIFCLLEFEPNKILSGNNLNNIQLWDINGSNNKKSLYSFEGHSSWINCLVKCNDKTFASASNDCKIRIWNYSNRECICTFNGHKNSVVSLTLLKTNKLCSGSSDCTIKIWDLKKKTNYKTLTGHKKPVKCVFQLSNGYIISGSEEKKIIIWYNYSPLHELEGHEGAITGFCEISNNKFASISNDKTIKIWDTVTMMCIKTLKDNLKPVISIIYHSSGNLISCSNDCSFKIWKYNEENINQNINQNKNININQNINIVFKTTYGKETTIYTEYNKTISEIITEYLEKMGKTGFINIDNKIKFLYNGKNLDIHSNKKFSDIKGEFNSPVTVIDNDCILGK